MTSDDVWWVLVVLSRRDQIAVFFPSTLLDYIQDYGGQSFFSLNQMILSWSQNWLSADYYRLTQLIAN